MLPILIPPIPRIKHIDFAEAHGIDEIDADRPAIELGPDGKIVDDVEERRRRWRRRCGLSKVLLISNALLLSPKRNFTVPTSVEICENLVTRQMRRQLQSLPRRAREDIPPLLKLSRPVTIPAKSMSPLAVAWLFSETNWRGLSTLRQVAMPAVHIQTLTWRWWTSVPEALRIGPAACLHESLKERVTNLCRFWECGARRMVVYDFYFLDPRLLSIQFEASPKRKRANLPTIDSIASQADGKSMRYGETVG